MKTTVWTEYRQAPYREAGTAPQLWLGSQYPLTANFRSVYSFPEEVANMIRAQGHTAGLRGQPVYSDTLFIDVDDDRHVLTVRQLLIETGVGFTEYDTGNRGAHFHVPHQPVVGTNTVYSHIAWLRQTKIWPMVDHSFYHEAGQFRVIGATHQKTGATKRLTKEFLGATLELPTKVRPPHQEAVPVQGTPEAIQLYFMNLLAKREPGGRWPHAYIISQSGRAAGFDRPTINESIKWWMSHQESPYPPALLERKLEGLK